MKKTTEYVKESWSIYTKKENFIFFARIMAVLVIVSTALGYIFSYFFPAAYWENFDAGNIQMTAPFLIPGIITTIVGFWIQSTKYMSIIKMGKKEKEIFMLGYKKMWKYFAITFVFGLIIAFGLVVLIIPAIIFGIWYQFSVFLVLDKGLRVKDALKKSKLMVKGKFWKLLWINLGFGIFGLLASILLSLIPYVGNLAISFVSPLFMLPSYLLYRDLSVRD